MFLWFILTLQRQKFPIFFKNSLQSVNGHNECQKILQLLATNSLKNHYDNIQTFLLSSQKQLYEKVDFFQ